MPINKARTVAIAAGVGLTYDNYNENMPSQAQLKMPFTIL
jgi:hypothetical protein